MSDPLSTEGISACFLAQADDLRTIRGELTYSQLEARVGELEAENGWLRTIIAAVHEDTHEAMMAWREDQR